MAENKSFVNTEDCPRCGCFMAEHFECNCGAMHGDHCLNCGRYTAPTLTRDQYVSEEDKAYVTPCTLGPVEHMHAPVDAEEFGVLRDDN